MTVPNSSTDTATFGSSNTANVFTSDAVTVGAIVFDAGASAYTIVDSALPFPSDELFIEGAGITNNSGVTQNFVIAGDEGSNSEGFMTFNNNASAGNLTVFTNEGATVRNGSGGEFSFGGTSSATNSTFVNNGGTVLNASGGSTQWGSTGSPGTSTFINNGGTVSAALGGTTTFSTPAGNATVIANAGLGGGDGGVIALSGAPSGTPRVEVFGNGTLMLSGSGTVESIGSIEGSGLVQLGFGSLTVGGNNLSTSFSGVISGTGSVSSLTKTGKGKLTLSKASTYTGGTTVSKGTLSVTNKTGSATGTGAVSVKAGALGGTGKISGAVTVASGTTAASLAPGSGRKPGTLTLLSTLTFNSLATCKVDLNSTTATADKVTALGVTINSGAQISIDDLGAGTLTAGTVFTIINNTAATPVAGTFANLADGSTLTIGSNTYQVSYEGGTGNDLTLTVQ